MTGDLHMGTVAGEPACRTARVSRLTSDVRIVTCSNCRLSRCFNTALRKWLLKKLRAQNAISEALLG